MRTLKQLIEDIEDAGFDWLLRDNKKVSDSGPKDLGQYFANVSTGTIFNDTFKGFPVYADTPEEALSRSFERAKAKADDQT